MLKSKCRYLSDLFISRYEREEPYKINTMESFDLSVPAAADGFQNYVENNLW